MNQDQAKGTAKDVAGKAQRELGKATGDTSEQIKGAAKQVEGKVQKGFGDAKDAVDGDDDRSNRR